MVTRKGRIKIYRHFNLWQIILAFSESRRKFICIKELGREWVLALSAGHLENTEEQKSIDLNLLTYLTQRKNS